MAKNTVLTLKKKVDEGGKVTMVTSYDYTMAALVEEAGIDMILVGDSLGMTMMGYDSTIPVTMDDMVHHTRCVTRATSNTFVVGDMPFLSYEQDVASAVSNAGCLMKEGRCQAVKLEGGIEVCPQVKAMVEAGIPVVGHIGLTPQSVNAFGGFKVQGKSVEAAKKLVADASRSSRPAPSPSSSSACPPTWAPTSPSSSPRPSLSASARVPAPTARSSWSRTCSP